MIAERLLTASLALTLAASTNAQTHVYVDDDAPAGGNGLSWQSAFNDLHDAIELAKALGQNRGEIRIAGGTYDAGSDPFEVPLAVPGIKPMRVLGGFAGLAFTPNPNLRDTDKYATFLDADNLTSIVVLTSAVVLSPGAIARPAYLAPLSATTLDGLRFRNTNAVAVFNTDQLLSARINDCSFVGIRPGNGAATHFTELNIAIERSLFALNTSGFRQAGGAIQITGGTSTIRACEFISNVSRDIDGGAVRIIGGAHTVTGCSFYDNTANYNGGALHLNAETVSLVRCDFYSNRSDGRDGGAAYIYTSGPSNLATIDDCVWEGNSARYGGALWIESGPGSPYLTAIRDTIFDLNHSTNEGGAVFVPLSSGAMKIVSSDYIDNYSYRGGAVSGRVSIDQSYFEENRASNTGGAVHGALGCDIESCSFVNNYSGGNGGAVSAVSAVTLTNFTGNFAGNYGGAGYNIGRFVSVVAHGNSADNGAGAYLIKEVYDSNISNNIGGGIEGAIQVINNSDINQNSNGSGVRFTTEPGQPQDLLISNSEINENELQGILVNTGNLSSAIRIEDSTIAGNGDSGIDISPTGTQSQVSLDMMRTRVVGNARHAIYSLAGLNSFNDSMVIVESLLQSTNFPAIGVSRVTDLFLVGVTAESSSPNATIVANGTSSMLLESSIIHHAGTAPSISLSESNLVIVQSLITGGMSAISQTSGSTIKLIGNLFDFDPAFVSPEGPDNDPLTWQDNNYRLSSGSEAIDAGAKLNILSRRDLDLDRLPRSKNDPGMPDAAYGFSDFIDLGAYEFQGTTCAPDVNNDGSVDQRDFTAWIAAYNAMSKRADQNFDGSVTPTDYTAWIAAYFVGCP